MEVRLVLLKGMIQFELHYMCQIPYEDQFVFYFIIEGNAFLSKLNDARVIGLPHLTYQAKPHTDIRSSILKVV